MLSSVLEEKVLDFEQKLKFGLGSSEEFLLSYDEHKQYIKEKEEIDLPITFYKSLENNLIYIDSNIFMDEKFEKILNNFQKYNLNIVIPNEQYNEIYNLKQKGDSDKSKKARNAFKNIEILLDLNILQIEDINENIKNKYAYADQVFIDKIKQHIQNKEHIIFFTDDADLRIRVKSMNKDLLIKIYGHKELELLKENDKKIFNDKWGSILAKRSEEQSMKIKREIQEMERQREERARERAREREEMERKREEMERKREEMERKREERAREEKRERETSFWGDLR